MGQSEEERIAILNYHLTMSVITVLSITLAPTRSTNLDWEMPFCICQTSKTLQKIRVLVEVSQVTVGLGFRYAPKHSFAKG